MFTSLPTNAFFLDLPDSIRFSGSLENLFSYSQTGDASPVMTDISTLRLRANSFLWRPWVATLDSNLAFSYTVRENSNSSTNRNISGDVNLNVFPQSRFPFHAFFRKFNSEIEGDLNNQSRTSTTYGVTQSYTTGASRLNLNYQHVIDEDESLFNTGNRGVQTFMDTEDSLELSLSHSMGAHDFSGNSRFEFTDRESRFQSEDHMLHVLRHDYRPDADMTLNNLFTYSDRTLETFNGAVSDLKIAQFNSNTFWRPKTKKRMLVTINSLLQGTGQTLDGKYGIFDTAGVSAQISYQWNPYLNLRALASADSSSIETRTRQRIGAEFSPADNEWFGFRHAYNLAAEISNITGEREPNRQEINLRAGHIFRRNFPTAFGNVDVSATQRASTIADTVGEMNRVLSHSLGLGWSKSSVDTSSFARLTISDTRRFSNSDNEFGLQQLNLQMSRNQNIDMYSSFTGNITFQANRTLENDNNGDNLDLNSSVSLNYSNNRLFDVRRLRLVSELRYMSESLFEIINSDGFDDLNRNNVFWQNRFYYDIGLLSFRLTTNIGQTNGEFNNFILLQIRRNF